MDLLLPAVLREDGRKLGNGKSIGNFREDGFPGKGGVPVKGVERRCRQDQQKDRCENRSGSHGAPPDGVTVIAPGLALNVPTPPGSICRGVELSEKEVC